MTTEKLSLLDKRWIAHEIMQEELEAAVERLSEIALTAGIKLDNKGLDIQDKKVWDAIGHTRASLAIEFVNAWHLVCDAFQPDNCPDDGLED